MFVGGHVIEHPDQEVWSTCGGADLGRPNPGDGQKPAEPFAVPGNEGESLDRKPLGLFPREIGAALHWSGLSVTFRAMPRAIIDGDRVRIMNVRNFDYRSRNDFTVRYEDREVQLSHLTGLDFYVSYWSEGMMARLQDVPAINARWLRLLLVVGPTAFLAIGLAGFFIADSFLAYPPGIAKPLIIVVEATLTLSIGVTLALLVAGPPERLPQR